jgi:hypothetical protein
VRLPARLVVARGLSERDRPLAAGHRVAVIAQVAVCVRKLEREAPRQLGVGHPLQRLRVAHQQLDGLTEAAQEVVGGSQPDRKLDFLAVLLIAIQLPNVLQRLLERTCRVAVRVHRRCSPGEARQVFDRLDGLIGTRVVVSEPVIDLLQPIGIDRLDRVAGGGVQSTATSFQKRLVCHILGQSVLEHKPSLATCLLVDEFEPLELRDVLG